MNSDGALSGASSSVDLLGSSHLKSSFVATTAALVPVLTACGPMCRGRASDVCASSSVLK